MVGRVFGEVGRPQNVYFGGNLKTDLVRHEERMTEFLLSCWPDRWLRLWNVDDKLRPDGELWFGNTHLYAELDVGTVPLTRVSKKMMKYERLMEHGSFVVWVTLRESRVQGLMKRVGKLADRALFTVLGWDRWIDANGETIPFLSGEKQ
ncbi:replication-relaxation family protein [Blastopirellula marina]|uniref:Uncharacterized protein n=1 Tax=Blastopirellula marina TaxID=124 RepID=A0A2S8GSE5_9BACT|nr:replication-relaxation family protein [Blastopirellula marina]PQO47355.1 hypothetical protein C5Y93_04755 [Blastopirellula marina]